MYQCFSKSVTSYLQAEDEERRQIEKADNQGYDVTKFVEDDKKFFDYAEECLDYARKRGRTILPVERVILVNKFYRNFMTLYE